MNWAANTWRVRSLLSGPIALSSSTLIEGCVSA